jgi:hypothetical protein
MVDPSRAVMDVVGSRGLPRGAAVSRQGTGTDAGRGDPSPAAAGPPRNRAGATGARDNDRHSPGMLPYDVTASAGCVMVKPFSTVTAGARTASDGNPGKGGGTCRRARMDDERPVRRQLSGRRQGWCTASHQRSATPAVVPRRAGQRQVSPVSGQQPVQPRGRFGDDLRGFTSQLLVPGVG